MSAVVTIRGHSCRHKKNRREDEDTIRLRRMLATAEATAFEDMDATSLALSWAMARSLPRSNLRCIVGTLDERQDFNLRLAEVEIARLSVVRTFGATRVVD